ncbi:hypothetical protein PHET_00197 [Paragonimus heterotremus]|uniref:EF-hand domain-containing protein n=1 Tax=Paragonimus heterotremus TaxID=100268 RepID=A0A8J4WMB1_9TREM|nr:hypothetical protein PHET_00197 [Paragonimus heterotremus]
MFAKSPKVNKARKSRKVQHVNLKQLKSSQAAAEKQTIERLSQPWFTSKRLSKSEPPNLTADTADDASSTGSFTELRQIFKELTITSNVEALEETYKVAAEKVFTRFDRYEDGKVDLRDLQSMLHQLHQAPTRAQMKTIKSHMQRQYYPDTDLDHIRFTYPQFCDILRNVYEPPVSSRVRLTEAFEKVSSWKSGFIVKSELSDLLQTLGDVMTSSEVAELWNELPKFKKSFIRTKVLVNLLMKR